MRALELERWERKHLPDLAKRVREWREANPTATLRAAIEDLQLWDDPFDRDVQWYVWDTLKTLKDPAVDGFPEMRAASKAAR